MSILTACGLFFTGVLTGCGAVRGENEADDGKISVVTTIFPQYDFVRQIAGDSVDLQMLLKPGRRRILMSLRLRTSLPYRTVISSSMWAGRTMHGWRISWIPCRRRTWSR